MRKKVILKEERIPFTKEGYQNVLREREELLRKRPDAVEHLKKAREMGDLSENGYYKASRARLSFLDAQLKKIDRLVRLGYIVQSFGTGAVEIGSTVVLSDGENTYSYTIVGGYESDPSKKTISHVSPIGKAIFGKRPSDVVSVHTPKGVKKFTIVSVS